MAVQLPQRMGIVCDLFGGASPVTLLFNAFGRSVENSYSDDVRRPPRARLASHFHSGKDKA